ncbi:MAG: O-antigen polymerase [Rubripirellula sp.]
MVQINAGRRTFHARDFVRLGCMVVLGASALGMLFVAENQGEVLLIALSVLAAFLPMIPMLAKRKYCAFEPATAVLALVLFFVTAKTWMILALDNSSVHVQNVLLLGYDTSVLQKGLLAMVVAFAAFNVGYLIRLPRIRMNTLLMTNRHQWDSKRLMIICLAICLVSFVTFVLLMRTVGFSMGDSLSAKRFTSDGAGGAERMFQVSYLYYRLAAFSKFAFYLLLCDLLQKRRSCFTLQGMLLVLTAMQSVAVPFFINNRAGIVLLLIDVIVILYFVRPRLLVPACVIGGALVAALLVVTLVSRKSDGAQISPSILVEQTLGGRDLMDISKSAHIVNAVPGQVGYVYGETLWGWVAAPVPSSIWPTKPMWAARGKYLMHKVFGNLAGDSGMPPGLIPELFWNLGWYGVVIGMFSFGAIAQLIFKAFEPFQHHISSVLIYSLLINRFVLFSLGNDLGTGIVKSGLDIVPMMFLILLVATRKKKAESYGYGTTPTPGLQTA